MAPEETALTSQPHNVEAEVALLGSLVLNNEIAGEIIGYIDRSSFYRPAHQILFDVIVELYDARKPVDLVILRDELTRRGALDRVGGVEYLTQIADAVPSSANAEYYAGIVRDKAIRRHLMEACDKIRGEAVRSQDEPSSILDRAEQAIFEVVRNRAQSEVKQIGDLLREAFTQIQDIHSRKDRVTGVMTGFFELDDQISGLQPSQLVIIAGRPSMGKTSLALRVAEHVGLVQQKGVLLFSLEMDSHQIAQNMLCSHTRVPSNDVRKGKISEQDFQRLLLAAGKFAQAPIYIDDSSGLTPLDLRARARRMAAAHKIELIIVDYLQLMESRGSESRQQEISVISRSLKALARELNVPLIALSQLSRAVEGREDHKPRMSDLRESGSIEQDADVVMLLYRDEYYNPDSSRKGTADVIVAKQRNGPTGEVPLAFLANFMRFENLDVHR